MDTAANRPERQVGSREARRRLLEEAREGRPGAWERLVDHYAQLVWSVPRRLGLSRADVEDVAQTTWIALYEHVGFIQSPEALPAWILITARRESRRLLRRQGTGEPGRRSADEPEASQDLPPEILARLERIQAVRDAVAELDPRCRRLLELLHLEPGERTYRDVAQALGIPTGSVGPIRIRCLARLAEILDRGGVG